MKYSHDSNEVAVKIKAKGLHECRLLWLRRLDNRSNFNGNNRNLHNDNNHVRGIAQHWIIMINMDTNNLYDCLCSYDNLELAFQRARKRKTLKHYVIEFEKNLPENLEQLRTELLLHSYQPKPLVQFIVRDPKTRKISKSDFRDRVIHHALCNIIEPIFDKTFIYDSFANRIGKGNLKALERFDHFKRIVSKNFTRECYVLKADIKKYFDEVDHNVLLNILRKKIKDEKVMWLIKKIVDNHNCSLSLSTHPIQCQSFKN